MATDAQILDAIKTQIFNHINNGAANYYMVDGLQIRYENLAELEKLRDKYEARVNASSASGMIAFAKFTR